MTLVAFLLLAASAMYALDVVLALETSAGMEAHLAGLVVPPMAPGERMAVVRFAGRVAVAQKITADREEVVRAVRRLGVGRIRVGTPGRGTRADARVWWAIEEACKLLPSGGEIRLLFGSEDFTRVPSAVRQYVGSRVRLYAAAVRRRVEQPADWPSVQTPPTIPGRYPPVSERLMAAPEATLRGIQALGGQIWHIARNTRSHSRSGISKPGRPDHSRVGRNGRRC